MDERNGICDWCTKVRACPKEKRDEVLHSRLKCEDFKKKIETSIRCE